MNIFNWFSKKKEAPATGERALQMRELTAIFPTYDNDSGVHISESNALTISAVFAAVRVLSSSIAFLPIYVYRRDENGRHRDYNHPLARLLHSEPNLIANAGNFIEQLAIHLLLHGNAYAYIEKDAMGNVTQLIPLLPDATNVYMLDGELVYQTTYYNQNKSETVYLKHWEVLHIRGMSADGIKGLSPVGLQREALGLTAAVAKHGASYFGKGAHIRGYLEHPGSLTDAAAKRMRESFEATYAGLNNAHKVALLEEGLKFNPISMNHQDAQFLETRQFQINDVARIFGLPSHMLNENSASTFSNIEHQAIEYIVHSLRPHLKRFEQEFNRKLLKEDEKGSVYIEFNVDALLRGDTASRYSSYSIARSGGWMSANDIRELEGLPRIAGLDEYTNPNTTPGKPAEAKQEPTEEAEEVEEVAEPDTETEERSLIRSLTRSAIQRILRKEIRASEKATKKDEYRSWRVGFATDVEADMQEALQSFGTAKAVAVAEVYRLRMLNREQPLTEAEIETETDIYLKEIEGKNG